MRLILLSIVLALVAKPALGQGSLASTMEVYVFPTGTQDQAQQQADEAACYEWAVSNSGSDPFDLQKQAEADQQAAAAEMEAAQSAGSGAGAKGAVRGAAAGAIIGEIADDDAGQGAAYGAALGVVRGRRKGRKAEAAAQEQAASDAANAAASTEAQMENFKKAFSVCLEAKEYLVKY